MYLFMHRDLRGAAVVLTGASSGIGRATALEFARRGANLALAARRDEPLEDTAEQCRRFGARVLVAPTDVRREDEVNTLARRAIDEFGQVDVWVNNAGVLLTGRLEDIPMDVCRGVIETNLFGTIHGCRAIIPHFRRRGRGALINVSSIAGKVGAPFENCYSASKFAVTGLSQSLRGELSDLPEVTVTTVLPAAIDTPLFQHAGNYMGREVQSLSPTYAVEKAARIIVNAAASPRREVYVGAMGRMETIIHALCPYAGEKLVESNVRKSHFMDKPARGQPGNVRTPMAEGVGASGGWRERGQGGSRSREHGGWSGTALGLAALGAGWLAFEALNSSPAKMAMRQAGESLRGQWRERRFDRSNGRSGPRVGFSDRQAGYSDRTGPPVGVYDRQASARAATPRS